MVGRCCAFTPHDLGDENALHISNSLRPECGRSREGGEAADISSRFVVEKQTARRSRSAHEEMGNFDSDQVVELIEQQFEHGGHEEICKLCQVVPPLVVPSDAAIYAGCAPPAPLPRVQVGTGAGPAGTYVMS